MYKIIDQQPNTKTGACANSNLIFSNSEGKLRIHEECKIKQQKQSMSQLCKSICMALTLFKNTEGVAEYYIFF